MLEQLKTIVNQYNLLEETKESFWLNFNTYHEEDKIEFDSIFQDYNVEKLNVWLHSICYKIKNWPECDYEYIVIRLEFDYNDKTVGKYEACYKMDGEFEDDYFVIY